ncbi:MAG: hydroxypyruvate isomerase family protein [Alphaproteobacteria bacterium]|nr:hydroxypyruvate isomerase family protein [Alphaproteobacteria bacterium]
MPRFAANLSTLFTERPFLDRFQAAADAGFAGVEIQFPYEHPTDAIRHRLEATGLELVLFNLPPGDWAAGDRGLGALPGREKELDQALETALEYARALNCRMLHVMAGVAPKTLDNTAYLRAFGANLRRLAPKAAEAGRTLLLEPINDRDMPGYVVNRTEDALSLIEAIGDPTIRLQLDLYHRQVTQGDLIRTIERTAPVLGHVQIAGAPERSEPDRGEIHYPALFDALDAVGYDGWIGCEYFPSGRTEDGLGWLAAYR